MPRTGFFMELVDKDQSRINFSVSIPELSDKLFKKAWNALAKHICTRLRYTEVFTDQYHIRITPIVHGNAHYKPDLTINP